MNFINPYSPITDIVIVHIFYINETHPSTHSLNPPIHPFLEPTHLVRVPFYFINLLPTSLLYIYMLLLHTHTHTHTHTHMY